MIDTATMEFAVAGVEGVLALAAAGLAFRYLRRAEVAEAALAAEQIEGDHFREFAASAQADVEALTAKLEATRDSCARLANRCHATATEMARQHAAHQAEIAKLTADRNAWRSRFMRSIAVIGNKSDKRKKAKPPLSLVA